MRSFLSTLIALMRIKILVIDRNHFREPWACNAGSYRPMASIATYAIRLSYLTWFATQIRVCYGSHPNSAYRKFKKHFQFSKKQISHRYPESLKIMIERNKAQQPSVQVKNSTFYLIPYSFFELFKLDFKLLLVKSTT